MTRRPALDGLRALAILAVIGYHYEQAHVPGGAVGVVVFFVLSGWLITSLLSGEMEARRRIDIGAFYGRRALRLLPALVFVVGLVVIAALIMGPAHNLGWAAPASLLYVNDLVMALGKNSGWLDPTWSLGVEQQFYLVWPLVIGVGLTRVPKQLLGKGMLGACAAMLIIEAIAPSVVPVAWVYFTPLGSAAPLLAGAGLALLDIRVPAKWGLFALAVLVSVCFLGPDLTQPVVWRGWEQLDTVTGAVLIAWLADADSAPVFTDRRVVWLGRRSYGLYLIHQAMLMFIVTVLAVHPTLFTAAVGVPASILFAAVMYRYVERPFLERKRAYARVTAPMTASGAIPVTESAPL